MDPVVARQNWRTLEAMHGFVYFAREAHDRFAALGADGQTGYFASRSAPMGAVSPAVTIATFYNFEPEYVRRCMAGVWERVTPAAVVEARLAAVDDVLRRVLGEATIGSDAMVEAASLARRASDAADTTGRPLAAGHQSLDRPAEPHLALWHDISVLREYRGDGHVASLMTDGVSPCEALVLHAATGEVSAEVLQATRRWSDEQWAAALAGLVERGLVDESGALTSEGRRSRQHVEDRTDALALPAWTAIGEAGSKRLRALVRPWSVAIRDSDAFALPT